LTLTLQVLGAATYTDAGGGALSTVILQLTSGAGVNVQTSAATGKIRGSTVEFHTCFSGWLISNA